MAYDIEIRLASHNGWFAPAEANNYYATKYARNGVTIHWWNDPSLVKDSDHDNIVNYILSKAQRGAGSVNYVLSNNKITMLVNPDNVAWASQKGNPTTVSIECSPHLNAEGYKKLGWLINELFNPKNGRYKINPGFWKHSDWFQTACPGTLDMNKIKAETVKWANGGYNPKPTPPPVVTPPPSTPLLTWHLWKEGEVVYTTNKQPTNLYDVNAKTWGEIKTSKTFNKGEKITIVGHVHNSALNRDYYITRYTFDNKNSTGFSAADLDVYVPPRPLPKPPEPTPSPDPEKPDPTPVEPTDPVEPPTDEYPNWFKKLVTEFIDWIKNKLNIGG